MNLIVYKISCILNNQMIFENKSFSLSTGDALTLTGPNGCGKTTLLRIIAGLQKASTGSVIWNGKINKYPTNMINYLNYNSLFDTSRTVIQIIDYWAAYYNTTIHSIELLDKVSLAEYAHHSPTTLSAGQLKRLSIARLLIKPSTLWLLDEPFITLDEQSIQLLLNYINVFRRRGGIVLLTNHTDIQLPNSHTLPFTQIYAHT